jgi:hypothetical protein
VSFGRFHDRNQASAALHASSEETSPYRPLAETRHGQVDVLTLDVFTQPTTQETLRRYPYLVLAGYMPVLAPDQVQALTAYVCHGGTVVLSVAVVDNNHTAFTGVQISGNLQAMRGFTWLDPSALVREAAIYTPLQRVGTVQTLAETASRSPLAVEHAVQCLDGSTSPGTVVTIAQPWLEAETAPLSLLAQRVLQLVQARTAVSSAVCLCACKMIGCICRWCGSRLSVQLGVCPRPHRTRRWSWLPTTTTLPCTAPSILGLALPLLAPY